MIEAGTYPITSTIIVKDGVTLLGNGSPVLKNALSSDTPILKNSGNNAITKGITFDDNNVSGSNGVVMLQGTGGTLQYNEIINCARYGFTTWDAHNFQILYNTVVKAQYGIAGSDYSSNSVWSEGGLVKGNVIGNCKSSGIKMKMWRNCVVTENTIDVGLKSWTSTSNGCYGISYSHADTPTQNCEVYNNQIIDTTQTLSQGIGIYVEDDLHLDWSGCPYSASGEYIHNNVITGVWWGIVIKHNGVEANYNSISSRDFGIKLFASYCKLAGNTGNIHNLGTGNVIT